MACRLILDTGVLVASERDRTALAELLEADDDVVIAAVTVAELRTGIEIADERHRPARADFLVRVLGTLPVEPYDVATAEAHGLFLAHVHREGSPREAHDLIIAATALATRRTPGSPGALHGRIALDEPSARTVGVLLGNRRRARRAGGSARTNSCHHE